MQKATQQLNNHSPWARPVVTSRAKTILAQKKKEAAK